MATIAITMTFCCLLFQKLLERTRARREKMAANRPMTKRAREPLAETNSKLPEPVIDAGKDVHHAYGQMGVLHWNSVMVIKYNYDIVMHVNHTYMLMPTGK